MTFEVYKKFSRSHTTFGFRKSSNRLYFPRAQSGSGEHRVNLETCSVYITGLPNVRLYIHYAWEFIREHVHIADGFVCVYVWG